MKNLPFDQALTKAQSWVGTHNIYAVGESEDDNKKIILVFTSDSIAASKAIPSSFYGHKVLFYNTGEIVPQELEIKE